MVAFIPLENFPTELMALLVTIAGAILLVAELRVFSPQRLGGSDQDRGSLWLIITTVALSLIVMFIGAYTGYGRIDTTWGYWGLAVLIAGLLLRQWSISALGSYFTPRVTIIHGQRLVQAGPYHYIRHPAYTGGLLELIGLSLAISNLLGVFAVLVLVLPALMYRIEIEESALDQEFGDEYQFYKEKTARLIPKLY